MANNCPVTVPQSITLIAYTETSIVCHFPFVVWRLNTPDNKTAHVLYDNIGAKKYWNGHTFLRVQFAFEWNCFRCFIKCIKISGLVLVCSVWLWYFLIVFNCFSWSLICPVEKRIRCTTADTESVGETIFCVCFVLFLFFNSNVIW